MPAANSCNTAPARPSFDEALRNQNPHRPAIVAAWIYGDRVAGLNVSGVMDLWALLGDAERNVCRDLVERIGSAPIERIGSAPSERVGLYAHRQHSSTGSRA